MEDPRESCFNFATCVCCVEQAFGADGPTGNCSPKDQGGPHTSISSLGKRGLSIALWVFVRSFQSSLL